MRVDDLELRHRIEGDRLVVSLVGELDVATARGLEAAIAKLCRHGTVHLVLDIEELSFIDSSGLRAILGILDACEQRGCEVLMTRGQRPVQRLFEIVGLMSRLPFVDAAGLEGSSRDAEDTPGGAGLERARADREAASRADAPGRARREARGL